MEIFDFSILRDLRRQHQLSIAALAEKSGVSTPVISKLERNQTRAELETIYKLAKGFGVTAAELLSLAERKLTQRSDAVPHQSGAFIFREIIYGNVRALYGKAPSGARLSRPAIHHNDYELCWVLNGRLSIALPNEKYELAAGESVQFDALLLHTYTALENCEIIIIHLKKSNRF